MGIVKLARMELNKILLPSFVMALVGPNLLNILSSCKILQNYRINVKNDQLRMLPLTMGLDIHYLLMKAGYYWEHLLIFLACVYAWIVVSEIILERRRQPPVSLLSMGHLMFICAIVPTLALIVMRNAYFLHEHWTGRTSSFMRKLVPVVWHNVGIVSKMRLAMHALAFFKRLERGSFEKEVLLLLITPIVSSMIMPFLTFSSLLLAPLNMEKLELEHWLYSDETKGFNEQLVVVLFEWYDVTAINGYYDLNWLCFFGFLASILWLCSSKETNRPNDGTFRSVIHKNMLKLLCLTAPFIMKAVIPKFHYLLWRDNQVDRSGYIVWCTQIYLHLFALISRVRLLQHIFSSFRPQN